MRKASARIKRPLWVVGLNIALALSVGTTQAFAEDITSVEQLLGITAGSNYVLTRNLDLLSEDADSATDDIQLADSVTGASPYYIADTFFGTFDGGGFTIFGLTKPLFNSIGGLVADTTVFDLNLEAATDGVTGQGILANGIGASGSSETVIDNVHVTGDVYGTGSVGGLVADNDGGTISNSSATGDVIGGDYVGGLVGYNGGIITNSFATGDVNGGDLNVGGLVGENDGVIENSFATGTVTGDVGVGGLAGANFGIIDKSYSQSTVTGLGDYNNDIGGLVGYNSGIISNSYAISTVTGEFEVGGLVGENFGPILNSYTAGSVTGVDNVGGLVGYNSSDVTNSYAESTVDGDSNFGGLIGLQDAGTITYSFSVNSDGAGGFSRTAYSGQCVDEDLVEGVVCGEFVSSFPSMLQVINSGLEVTPFAYDNCLNSGIPYLVPLIDSYSNGCEEVSPRINSSYLLTQVLDGLRKSVGFAVAKSDLSKLNLALLDQVKGDTSAPLIGAKLYAYQSPSTSLSTGSLLQLEINFEPNKSMQVWVKTSDGQYVLVGDLTFDKDGNAVLPGIEFKKSGSYDFVFVNSDKKTLTQPDLENKVSGLTVYVNQ